MNLSLMVAVAFLTIGTFFLLYRYMKNRKVTKGHHKEKTNEKVQNTFNKQHTPSPQQTKLNFLYCNDLGRFSFLQKKSHLTILEQAKIDQLNDYLQTNISKIISDWDPRPSSILFSVVTNKNTGCIELMCYLHVEPISKDIKKLSYKLLLSSDIRETDTEQLIVETEQIIQESKRDIEVLIRELKSKVTYQALFDHFQEIAAHDQFQVILKEKGDPLSIIYYTSKKELWLESVSFYYAGKWVDGQTHYLTQPIRQWNENATLRFTCLYESLNLNLEEIEMLSEKVLRAFEKKFKEECEYRNTTDFPHFDWPNFNNGFNFGFRDEIGSNATGTLEDIEDSINQFQEELCPGNPFINLEVTEQNLNEIKQIVKSNFKKAILKFHPDKQQDSNDEEKAKTIIKFYKQIENHYKARGLDW